MGKGWREGLASFFEDLVVIRTSQQETRQHFDQFCEFIAEPAFEDLQNELRHYKIKSKIKKIKGKSISFRINFPRSGRDNFHYILILPRNQLELRLTLQAEGRANKKSRLEVKEEAFLGGQGTKDVLKMTKEELIQDIIDRYRNFNFEATTRSA